MAASVSIDDLDSHGWNRLQDIVERYERACAASFPQRLEDFVPPAGDPIRNAVLEELIRTDLELQWRNGRRALVDDYLRRFGELAGAKCIPSLLHDEYRVRHQFGDRPGLPEYETRQPVHYPHFAELVRALGVVAAADATPVGAPAPAPWPAAPKSPEESIGTMFAMEGQFKKIRRLGRGAFGEVWEAQAPGGVPAAIKRIFGTVSPQAIERERQSLDLICSGKLRHPFLLQVFGWWLQDGKLHIAMELADSSLDDRLKEVRKQGLPGIPAAELRQVFIDAADALDFLNHEKNILHRDVKPANMLLMAHRLKLCDFGLSRMTANLASGSGRTLGAGTPVFMAPEIVAGYQSRHSDQYSLAATYHMLRTGKPIFRGKPSEVRQQHVAAPPQLDAEVLSRAEITVLARALQKSPDDRYENCRSFVGELVEAMVAAPAAAVSSSASSGAVAGGREGRIAPPGAPPATGADDSALAGSSDLSELVVSGESPEKLTFDSSEDATNDSGWYSLPEDSAAAGPAPAADAGRDPAALHPESSADRSVASSEQARSARLSSAATVGVAKSPDEPTRSGPAAGAAPDDWSEEGADQSRSGKSSFFPDEAMPPKSPSGESSVRPDDPSFRVEPQSQLVWQHLHRSGTVPRIPMPKSPAPPAPEGETVSQRRSRTEVAARSRKHSKADERGGGFPFLWVVVLGMIAAIAAVTVSSLVGK